MYTRPVSRILDLVENPVEREWVELKSWVDLSAKEHVAGAQCARHLAAIANFGGGYLVFGFENDGKRSGLKSDVRRASILVAELEKRPNPFGFPLQSEGVGVWLSAPSGKGNGINMYLNPQEREVSPAVSGP